MVKTRISGGLSFINPVPESRRGQEGSEPPDGGTDMQFLLGNCSCKFLEPMDHGDPPDGESLSVLTTLEGE